MGFFFTAYTILDGFDLGIGILFRFIGRKPEERQTLLRVLAPVWDGNELWLITGAMAVFGAFPAVYATVFSGFYLAIFLTVFSLIFRAITFEFWSVGGRFRPFWDAAFTIGSLLPPLLLGIALGNVIQGVPLTVYGEYQGDFLTLFRPFPIAVGLFGVLIVAMQGSAYAAMKTTGELQARARKFQGLLRSVFPVALILLAATTYIYMPEVIERPLALAGIAAAIGAWVVMFIPSLISNDRDMFVASSTMISALWVVGGAVHFPHMVAASNDPINSPTVASTASPGQTLWLMLAVALIGIPLAILYVVYVYRVFRGRTVTAS